MASEVCLLPASISLGVDSSNLESINFGWQWRSLTPISKPCCLALRKRSPIATSAQSTRSFQAFRSRILGEFMLKRLQTPPPPDRSSRLTPLSNFLVSNSGDFWLMFSHLFKISGEELGAARKFLLYKYLAPILSWRAL